MKKRIDLILILFAILLLSVFAACKDKKQTVTVTVNPNIDGAERQTFTVNSDEEFYGKLQSYIPQTANGITFAGWFDEDGVEITSNTRWGKDGTATARWHVNYVTEYYFETADGFAKDENLTSNKTAELGATVYADRLVFNGYVFDSSNLQNVESAKLVPDTVLKLYYKSATFTVTFNKNDDEATGEMAVQTFRYGILQNLTPCGFTRKNSDRSDFGGWNTKPDGSGNAFYADQAGVTLTENLVLYAQWKVSYTEQIYVERLVDGDYVYVPLYDELTKPVFTGLLNNSVPFQTAFNEPHYFLDESHPDSAVGTKSLKEGDELKAYYSIERFTVIYTDVGLIDTVRYNEQYTVRTPASSPDGGTAITSYNSAPDGSGQKYDFGSVIALTEDLILYPIVGETAEDNE